MPFCSAWICTMLLIMTLLAKCPSDATEQQTYTLCPSISTCLSFPLVQLVYILASTPEGASYLTSPSTLKWIRLIKKMTYKTVTAFFWLILAWMFMLLYVKIVFLNHFVIFLNWCRWVWTNWRLICIAKMTKKCERK
jgi:hypothetical protein